MAEVSNCKINWQLPTFLLVTGASRGLGAKIAVEFSKKLVNGSYLVIIARNQKKLDEVLEEVKQSGSPVYAQKICMDLVLLDSASYEHFFMKYKELNFPQVVIVNNAGTLGDVSKTILNLPTNSDVRNYFDTNVHSAMFITVGFFNAFKKAAHKVVINISSLAAQQPFKGWSLYCTGKAARDMFFRVLAEEEKDITVLNYAPGPLLTDMLPQILEQAVPELRAQFQEAQSLNQLLTTDYTVSRLIEILDRGNFKSGDHVDVFDTNY